MEFLPRPLGADRVPRVLVGACAGLPFGGLQGGVAVRLVTVGPSAGPPRPVSPTANWLGDLRDLAVRAAEIVLQ